MSLQNIAGFFTNRSTAFMFSLHFAVAQVMWCGMTNMTECRMLTTLLASTAGKVRQCGPFYDILFLLYTFFFVLLSCKKLSQTAEHLR